MDTLCLFFSSLFFVRSSETSPPLLPLYPYFTTPPHFFSGRFGLLYTLWESQLGLVCCEGLRRRASLIKETSRLVIPYWRVEQSGTEEEPTSQRLFGRTERRSPEKAHSTSLRRQEAPIPSKIYTIPHLILISPPASPRQDAHARQRVASGPSPPSRPPTPSTTCSRT